MKYLFKKSVWHSLLCSLLILIPLLAGIKGHAQKNLSGSVIEKESGLPLAGAHLQMEKNPLATITDEKGQFSFKGLKTGQCTLKVSYIGFKTLHVPLNFQSDTVLRLVMQGAALLGEEVNIVATRAGETYPTTFSTIDRIDLEKADLARDMPYLLQTTPSTVVTSDAGNGIGYTGIAIRGTDLTRINVTVNGIPLNDPESQGVWFVDLPDIAASAENIQIQRGVGTSTNGAGAFGASVNILTSDLHQDPYAELTLSGGSFKTGKVNLRFGTGLLANRISVDGRLSCITSAGYIDRASTTLKSYYLAGGYYGKNTTLKLINFSGTEKTYQAWEGVPKDSLAVNRTFNPAGLYYDKNGIVCYYPDQTDNYQQDNYQLIFSQKLARGWNLNTAIHYTKGKGYYESYDQGASFSSYGLDDVIIGGDTISYTDLVNRKMMDNDFFGITFSTSYEATEKLRVILGGAWNRYHGRHTGKITWAEYASNSNNESNWYYNTGLKTDFNVYGKVTYQWKKLTFFADLQYRRVNYTMQGILDDQRNLDQQHDFNFFNPKIGLYYTINKKQNLYFSWGMAHREPSRNNYKDSDSLHVPTYERLQDFELGYTFKTSHFTLEANGYYMRYHNQLVLTGEINNVGEAVMVNVPVSYRLGMELAAAFSLLKDKLMLDITATFSRNKIRNFIQYIDTYDDNWNFTGQVSRSLGESDLSFSPSVIAGSTITWKPFTQLSLGFITKYVGRQYIDNTGDNARSLNGYLVNGINIDWSLTPEHLRGITFNLAVNNLFSVKYETNGWVYPYYMNNVYQESNGYFPQALINFLFGITLKI